MQIIEKNYFSKEALDNLDKAVAIAFIAWKDVEITRYSFYKMNDGLILSAAYLFANDYLYKVTLEFEEQNNSWIYEENCISNLNEKRPL